MSSTKVPSCPVGRRGCARGRHRGPTFGDVPEDGVRRPAEDPGGIAGGQVQGAARRLARHGGEAVVGEGEVLRVVPECGDGVAVEVPHHRVPLSIASLGAELPGVGRTLSAKSRELIHEAAVARALFVRVLVVLVARERLCPINPERVRRVRIPLEQGRGEPVDRRRPRARVKGRLPGWVDGHGVGGKVRVERVILLEDDHQMLDRGRRLEARGGGSRPDREHCEQQENDPHCHLESRIRHRLELSTLNWMKEVRVPSTPLPRARIALAGGQVKRGCLPSGTSSETSTGIFLMVRVTALQRAGTTVSQRLVRYRGRP